MGSISDSYNHTKWHVLGRQVIGPSQPWPGHPRGTLEMGQTQDWTDQGRILGEAQQASGSFSGSPSQRVLPLAEEPK